MGGGTPSKIEPGYWQDGTIPWFTPSDLITMCPYKGTARYWSVRVGDNLVPDLAWSYPDPIPENPKIRDLVCFFNERVDLTGRHLQGDALQRLRRAKRLADGGEFETGNHGCPQFSEDVSAACWK